MRHRIAVVFVLVMGLAALAWAAIEHWDLDAARIAASTTGTGIEMKVDAGGRCLEVEYHYPLSMLEVPEGEGGVPQAVQEKMAELYGKSVKITAIEKERHPSGLYWELATTKDGKKHEVMFRPDGTPVSFEIEIDGVPATIAQRLTAEFGTLASVRWEKIVEGADPNGPATEYHAKFEKDGKSHKVALKAGNGQLIGVWYEIQAELEVPAR